MNETEIKKQIEYFTTQAMSWFDAWLETGENYYVQQEIHCYATVIKLETILEGLTK